MVKACIFVAGSLSFSAIAQFNTTLLFCLRELHCCGASVFNSRV